MQYTATCGVTYLIQIGNHWATPNFSLVGQFALSVGAGSPCTTVPSYYCFGDGSAAACPCGNNSTPGQDAGCLNSLSLAGRMRAIGLASVTSDSLQLQASHVPNGPGLYFQGPAQVAGGLGMPFGDGLRCVGGSPLMRLGIVLAMSGTSTYPTGTTSPNDVPISIKGAVLPGTQQYQLWYRDSGAFCTVSSVFNLTNAASVTWTP